MTGSIGFCGASAAAIVDWFVLLLSSHGICVIGHDNTVP